MLVNSSTVEIEASAIAGGSRYDDPRPSCCDTGTMSEFKTNREAMKMKRLWKVASGVLALNRPALKSPRSPPDRQPGVPSFRIAAARRAVQLDPLDQNGYGWLAEVRERARRYDQAIEALNDAIAQAPTRCANGHWRRCSEVAPSRILIRTRGFWRHTVRGQ